MKKSKLTTEQIVFLQLWFESQSAQRRYRECRDKLTITEQNCALNHPDAHKYNFSGDIIPNWKKHISSQITKN